MLCHFHVRTSRSKPASAPTGKKPVAVSVRKYVMIPVRREDYMNADQLAAQLAQRWEFLSNPEKPHAQVIQEVNDERIKLQLEHNPGIASFLANRENQN